MLAQTESYRKQIMYYGIYCIKAKKNLTFYMNTFCNVVIFIDDNNML